MPVPLEKANIFLEKFSYKGEEQNMELTSEKGFQNESY